MKLFLFSPTFSSFLLLVYDINRNNVFCSLHLFSQLTIEPDANKSETLLNSVINALEKRSIDNEESYDKSYAIVSALTMRAKKRLVLQQYQDSIDDALRVVEIEEEMSASSTTEPPNNDDAYRILAEAYEKMGNYSMAIQTLRKSSLINSASATKANNEIKRILALE